MNFRLYFIKLRHRKRSVNWKNRGIKKTRNFVVFISLLSFKWRATNGHWFCFVISQSLYLSSPFFLFDGLRLGKDVGEEKEWRRRTFVHSPRGSRGPRSNVLSEIRVLSSKDILLSFALSIGVFTEIWYFESVLGLLFYWVWRFSLANE